MNQQFKYRSALLLFSSFINIFLYQNNRADKSVIHAKTYILQISFSWQPRLNSSLSKAHKKSISTLQKEEAKNFVMLFQLINSVISARKIIASLHLQHG
jgi:hypothetical protein